MEAPAPHAPPPAADAPPPPDAPADAGDPETVQMTLLVLQDAIEGGIPATATKVVIDLAAAEPSITVERSDGEPLVVALPAEEIARRILAITGDADADAGAPS